MNYMNLLRRLQCWLLGHRRGHGTIANLIERFMLEFSASDRPLGIDTRYRLRKLQRHPIGAFAGYGLWRMP